MTAKQAWVSASLVVVLGGSRGAALADADSPPEQTVGEARPAPSSDRPGAKPPPTKKRQPTGRFEIGAGFSTDEGFIARAVVAQTDLFRTGNQLLLDARISARRQLFLLRFVDPHVLGSDLSLGTDLYGDSRRLPGLTRQALGGSLTLSRPVGDHLQGFVGYRLEQVSVIDDWASASAPRLRGGGLVPQPTGGLLSSVSAGMTYSTLDTPVLPTRGTTIGVSAEVADPHLGSELHYGTVRGWASTHQPIGPFTLHLGGTIAAIGNRDPFGVPLSERLFLDGSSDVRGFAPGAIGPRDPVTGRPLGGNVKVTGRAELEVPLVSRIGLSAAGFYDAGGIFDLRGCGGIGRSVGFGLIWRSPIGALAFDWAFPLEGGKPRFVFGLGF